MEEEGCKGITLIYEEEEEKEGKEAEEVGITHSLNRIGEEDSLEQLALNDATWRPVDCLLVSIRYRR